MNKLDDSQSVLRTGSSIKFFIKLKTSKKSKKGIDREVVG